MHRNRLGLSMIEVLITLGVMSVAALASASLLTSGQRGLRALNGGTEYMSDVSRLQLFFASASPTACANALFSGSGRPFLPQPAGSPSPLPLPMTAVSRIEMDGIVLANVYGGGGASRFSSMMLQELFTSLRSRVDSDPSDSDPTPNATVYVGQIAFQGLRTGDVIGARSLPDFFVPISFTVRDPIPPEVTGPVIACQMGVARPTLTGSTDQIEIERRTCVDAFGGVYNAARMPRCVMRSLVLAEDHAAAQDAIDALPSSLWPSPGPSPRVLPTGVIVGGQLFAQNLTASQDVSANRLTVTSEFSTGLDATTQIKGTLNVTGDTSLRGSAELNGSAICTEGGTLCRAPVPTGSPTPSPSASPSPSPTPALVAAEYTVPGSDVYYVPPGVSGQIQVVVIGAGGSGGCGDSRNGSGGKRGEMRTNTFSVTGPMVISVKVGRSIACEPRSDGGRPGLAGESSSFGALSVAAGGAGGRKNVSGTSGGDRCYPNIDEGNGESGPENLSGPRAMVCACDNDSTPSARPSSGLSNENGFLDGCPTDIPGAGGGGGADNWQGGRGGHGLVRVTPVLP